MTMSEKWKALSLTDRREVKVIIQAEGIKPESAEGQRWLSLYAAQLIPGCDGDVTDAKEVLIDTIRCLRRADDQRKLHNDRET